MAGATATALVRVKTCARPSLACGLTFAPAPPVCVRGAQPGNCPTDSCSLSHANQNAGGAGQLFQFIDASSAPSLTPAPTVDCPHAKLPSGKCVFVTESRHAFHECYEACGDNAAPVCIDSYEANEDIRDYAKSIGEDEYWIGYFTPTGNWDDATSVQSPATCSPLPQWQTGEGEMENYYYNNNNYYYNNYYYYNYNFNDDDDDNNNNNNSNSNSNSNNNSSSDSDSNSNSNNNTNNNTTTNNNHHHHHNNNSSSSSNNNIGGLKMLGQVRQF